ncbi:MAG: C39 family peptidase [Anaerolineae bacterium]
MTQSKIEREESLAAPPRLLMYVLLCLLLVIVLAVVGALIFVGSDRRLTAVIPFAGFAAIALPVAMILAAVLLRHDLPRRFWLWITLIWVVIGLIGGVGGLFVYRDVLPPRYQEQMLTYVPALRALMPPTPEGGAVPTVAVTSAISPEQLLAMPLLSTTPPSEAPVLVEVTLPPEATATPSATPSPSLTPEPTESAADSTPQPTTETVAFPTTPPEQILAASLPSAAHIYGLASQMPQEWNNCGPANITQALSFYGWQEDQKYAASYLRPNQEDKNVSPGELVNFVNTQTGVRAITRIGGDATLLKALLAANFPVLIETTFTPEGYDWIGHYQTLVGYDDAAGNFYVYDTYLGVGDGSGVPEAYSQFDRDWQAFNRVFIVVYDPSRESVVQQILGDRADLTLAAEHALEVARDEARQDPQNPFAWFNMGTALNRLERYEEAAAAFDQAIAKRLPFRMLWYQFGPFEAYFNVGRFTDVLSLAQNNLASGADLVEETHYWMGRVYEAQGDMAQAASAYQRALSRNPLYTTAREALDRVS